MSSLSAAPQLASRARRLREPQVLRSLRQTRGGLAGLILVGLVLLGAICSWIGVSPHPPQSEDLNATLKGSASTT